MYRNNRKGLTLGKLLVIILVAFLLIKGVLLVSALCVEDVYRWPEVTRCRCCNKTIYAWQDYEQRLYPTRLNNTSGFSLDVQFFGWSHRSCNADGVTPIFITLEGEGEGDEIEFHYDGILHPQETIKVQIIVPRFFAPPEPNTVNYTYTAAYWPCCSDEKRRVAVY